MKSSRAIRRTQTPPKPDSGAWEYLANRAHKSQAAAEDILDEFAKVVPPSVYESIARKFGWCDRCQGERTVPGVRGREVPCLECAS